MEPPLQNSAFARQAANLTFAFFGHSEDFLSVDPC
jgi:hypothetical protein